MPIETPLITKKKVQPISPDKIIENLDDIIPEYVIESVNELLKKKFRDIDDTIYIKQDELIKLILDKSSIKREEIFDNHYLDFEALYEKYGWEVSYDKPGYDESYTPNWKFSKAE